MGKREKANVTFEAIYNGPGCCCFCSVWSLILEPSSGGSDENERRQETGTTFK